MRNHLQFKRIYGKIAIIMVAAMWAYSAYIQNDAGKAVAAITHNTTDYTGARIEAAGEYGIAYLNKNAKERMLREMARKIGINRYEITSEKNGNIEITRLTQSGVNGNVECQIITTESKLENSVIQARQSIKAAVELKNNSDLAGQYGDILEEIFKKYNVNPKMKVEYYS